MSEELVLKWLGYGLLILVQIFLAYWIVFRRRYSKGSDVVASLFMLIGLMMTLLATCIIGWYELLEVAACRV